MVGSPSSIRIAERREASRREIVDAAWEVAREHGLAALTLRLVAERVGMRPPSLYSHFDSKHAIYDAMFGQAWLEYEQAVAAEMAAPPRAPRETVHRVARCVFDFSTADLARYQLMNQRSVPGFEPSAESYAPAVRVLDAAVAQVESFGVTDRGAIDILLALIGGMVDMQLANDPGGDRWSQLLDRAVDMWADAVGLPPDPPGAADPSHSDGA
ncbi:TetR/AcrR family transcriptional regulator [Nocardioides sp.]|uniref:TetR/AcrR family transcriptional regulator n=1 Tax=Nocardioides sp. TaxID=35761 RepID=UPI0027361D40|nr:TetR/AcrR family transcriptional regulator [Nocardioides sp.]MDP3892374.1 TetR/AcrR family transcriptional regulator [Nocardioides sp.]